LRDKVEAATKYKSLIGIYLKHY
jgi:tetratricopeptide (TPR) repeat protein